MQVPQVKLHLRERKVQQQYVSARTHSIAGLSHAVLTSGGRAGPSRAHSYLALKKKEDGLRELEQALEARERAAAAREAALDERARQLGKASLTRARTPSCGFETDRGALLGMRTDERAAMLGVQARTRTLSLV